MPSHTISQAALAVAVAGLAAGGWAYGALYPASQLFGRVVVAGTDPGEIALTYDDGPNPDATERLLEVLGRHEVRASFFLIGGFVRQRPDLARAIAAAGHLVGNHTMTHPWLAWQSRARIQEELRGCNAALEDALGAPVRFFRPPHGARRPYALRTARELGLTTVQWNVTCFDWSAPPPQTILAHASKGILRNQRRSRASNVLLHDGGHLGLGAPRMASVEATDRLITHYKQTGARFVTVDKWS